MIQPSALALALCLASSTAAQDLFLTDARIVDPAAQEVRRGNLLIVDGVIAGSPEKAPEGFSGTTVDLDGKWVVPGLNDLHTHSYGNMAPGRIFDGPGTAVVARRMLYAGVTGFLDLFGDEATLYSLRQQQRAGEAGGADLFASLSCLTAPKGHCTEYGAPTRVMKTPDEARAVVADLAKKSPDVVKIVYQPSGRMPSIDKETLAAAVATAAEHGIKTVIHIGTWQEVADAIDAGATAVTHVPRDAPIPAGLARRMAEQGVYSIPTLAVATDRPEFVADPEVLAAPLARALTTEAVRGAYRGDEEVARAAERREQDAERTARVLASVKEMADAGVTILAGSDSGNYGTIQGYSAHRELVKLVAAGLTPWQALAASTTAAGELLDRRFGVAAGDEANLVVLEASPLDDIRNTQRIAIVIHRGEIVDRQALLSSQ